MGIKWTRDGTPIIVTNEDRGTSAGVLVFVFVLFAIIGAIAKAFGAM